MSRMYDLKIRANADEVSIILAAIKGSAELVSVEQVPEDDGKKRKGSGTHHYHGGKRNKGIKGVDLAMSVLPASMEDLKRAFKNSGFAEKSVSPVLSNLSKEKKIFYDQDNRKWRSTTTKK